MSPLVCLKHQKNFASKKVCIMQSESQQNDFLFHTEEKTIKEAEQLLSQENHDSIQLLKSYKKLFKRYKKLFKQLKNLISMTDRQQKQVNRLNNELTQTNKLLADVSGKASLTISTHHIRQLSSITSHLVLTKNQLLSFNHFDNNQTDYMSLLQNLNMVTTRLQESIMQTKMQPLSIIYAELPKIISLATKNQNKEVQLNLDGNNVKIDNDFMDSLHFILGQLVQNACEHGIETKNERETLSKPSVGNIHIFALKKGGHVIIEMNDDGKGFDFEALSKKDSTLKNQESIELKQWINILKQTHQNFHKNSGLQKIFDKVEEMKGSIRIQRKNKQGITYLINLPESISIIQGLIVDVFGERFIIPQNNIVELVSIYDSDIISKIEYLSEHEVIRLREKLIPLVRLSDVLNIRKPFTSETRFNIVKKYSEISYEKMDTYRIDNLLLFVVLRVENERFGLVIDQIIGNEEIVYMPLHSLVKNLKIYSGVSILGDGCVSMILNPEGIFKHVNININNPEHQKDVVQENSKINRILIFKSGIKEQFAVLLGEVSRLVRIKKEDIQYKSEIPLIAIDRVITQVIVLDQFLEVSAIEPGNILYILILKNTDRPLGILMSSLCGIHSIEIEIEKDTFVQKGVLGTMKLNEKLTIFLDILHLTQMAKMAYYNGPQKLDSALSKRS
jgi:two-component system chemotaxis sensor kinase CheA